MDQRLKQFLDLSDHPAFTFDAGSWQILYANEPALLLYNYSFNEFLSLHVESLFALEDWPRFRNAFAREFSEARRFTVRRMGTWRHREGSGHFVEVQMAMSRLHTGKTCKHQDLVMALVFPRSLARFRVPTQAWRRLSQSLNARLEEERREIADTLHETIAQDLTAMKFQLKALERWLAGMVLPDARDALAGQMGAVYRSVEDILKETHRTASRLRPDFLDDFGLKSAVENYIRFYEQQTGHLVRLTVCEDTPLLPPSLQTALFRILQEALENVQRHAKADRILVEMAVQNEGLVLTVADNGQGMTMSKVEAVRNASIGILSMQERARMFGGNLKIEAAPEGGTRVEVTIPLPPPRRLVWRRPDGL